MFLHIFLIEVSILAICGTRLIVWDVPGFLEGGASLATRHFGSRLSGTARMAIGSGWLGKRVWQRIPHCLMSIPPGRLIIASTENLRGGHAFQARLIAGLTAAGFFAKARVSSSPVSARMFRDRAAGLSRVNSAFIPMIGRLAMSSRVTAR